MGMETVEEFSKAFQRILLPSLATNQWKRMKISLDRLYGKIKVPD